MAKTREIYVTVGELRKWLRDVPDDYILVRDSAGISSYPPDVYPHDRHIAGPHFSLVPEDEEVIDG